MKQVFRTIYSVWICIGGIPFLIWAFRSHTIWPVFFLATYLLTAYHIVLLIVAYPGSKSAWYWKPVVLAIILHCAVIGVFLTAAFMIVATGIKPPIRMFFSFVVIAALIESWARLRLFMAFQPHSKSGEKKRRSPHHPPINDQKSNLL